MWIINNFSIPQYVKGGKTETFCSGIALTLACLPAMASGAMDEHKTSRETEITITPPSPINCVSGRIDEHTVRFDESSPKEVEPSDSRDDFIDDKSASASSSKPKKSLFEITSVIDTGNDFSRGESLGNDVEDSELDDTLSETQENVGSLPSSLTNVKSVDNSQNHVSSRFRIVKILRTEPYRKGRWNCQESVDQESIVKGERQTSKEDTKTSVGSTLPVTSKHEVALKHIVDVNKEIVAPEQPGSAAVNTKQEGPNSTKLGLQENYTHKTDNVDRTQSNYNPQGEPQSTSLSSTVVSSSVISDVNRAIDLSAARVGEQSLQADSTRLAANPDVPVVVPIVNTIETALDQITVIKSTLLTVVKEEVERLKEIILTLTAENNQLKEENERLRLLVDDGKVSHPDGAKK